MNNVPRQGPKPVRRDGEPLGEWIERFRQWWTGQPPIKINPNASKEGGWGPRDDTRPGDFDGNHDGRR